MKTSQLPSCAYLQTFTKLAPAYVVGPARMDAPVLQLNFVHIFVVEWINKSMLNPVPVVIKLRQCAVNCMV
jgi:hypothetical protein